MQPKEKRAQPREREEWERVLVFFFLGGPLSILTYPE
jgi:hypothetical protein